MQETKTLYLSGTLEVPGDKSVSHRAVIFASLANGLSIIHNYSPAQDCQSTISCLQKLGVEITANSSQVTVNSKGVKAFRQPKDVLNAENSGTTIRLLSALVAALPIKATFDGDQSLQKRPMSRVLSRLETLGAKVSYEQKQGYPPFTICGGNLTPTQFALDVASAQVEAALVLAGLLSKGKTVLYVPGNPRDHTIRMMNYLNISYNCQENIDEAEICQLSPQMQGKFKTWKKLEFNSLENDLVPFEYRVPADISSAAFFMVAATLIDRSRVTLKSVGINSGRTLVIDVLKRMGANIEITNEQLLCGEPVADIEVSATTRLRGTVVSGDELASGIDEIPVLALAGSLCSGKFVVKDAHELRVKESDRIAAIVCNLKDQGVLIEEHPDGFEITGQSKLPGGGKWQSLHDHRMTMTGLVANLLAENHIDIDDISPLGVSYPNFIGDLESLLQGK